MDEEELNFVVVDHKGHAPSSPSDFKVQRAGGALPLELQEHDDPPATTPAAAAPRPDLATPTMADLYMKQGHHREAMRMWQRLLAAKPGDAAILAKINQCRTALAAGAPTPTTAPAPPASASDPRKARTLATLERWLANARRMRAA